MIFSNCKVFREAVREYCLLSGKHVTFTKNERYKLKAMCKAVSCPWQIYVAWKNPTDQSLVVKYYNPIHNCVRVFENTQASSKWLRDKFLPRIQSNPTMPPQSIVNSASSEFKVGISMIKAYMAKAEAFRIIEGTVDEQYTMLWDYCHELEDKNSGSTTKMHYACHLKGIYGGQLLTVVGINPNNKTWVLAYDVVGMETRESWTWFIDLLAKDVDIVNSHGWAVISDKQKGLPGPFEDIVPNVETRFCVRHLYDNFNKTYKGNILRDQLWTYARATNVPSFNYQMELMKALDSNAWEWLAEKPPTQWSKSHFRTLIKCDMLPNNLCESFNNSIKTAKDKPIITMLEMIRCLLMRRIQWRKDKMSSWPHQLCKNIFYHVQHKKLKACNYTVQCSGGPKYQVDVGRGDQYMVDLDNHTCSCRKWDLSDIPYAHGIAAIHYK
ncbi:uncharacterized protein LOC117627509 [Prunus dulcis]|uniref:uncharacterized protein LOC117627509 n=1 Tax=Prunus dulcis TaxID=3755 RepID=UPI0014836573|nr:uncharacterized protein LOC117627509 [Prunus dulcis]